MKYRVIIKWLNHPAESADVEAANAFQAKELVIQGKNKGLYDAINSTATPIS